MDLSTFYLMVADAVLVLHVLFVIFIVIGLLLIFAGKVLAWSWVLNPWFRLTHLVAITVVVVQSWFDVICPLTNVEMRLRSLAGDVVYYDSFISHWLGKLLYYQVSPWVFVICYTIFGVIVTVSWFWIHPKKFF